MTIRRMLAAAAAVALAGGSAGALTDAEKCQSSELTTAAKYGFCRLKAEVKAVKTASMPLGVRTVGYGKPKLHSPLRI